jgi:hypothetical protein
LNLKKEDMIFEEKILKALIEFDEANEEILTKVFHYPKSATPSEAFVVGKCLGKLLSFQEETSSFDNLSEREIFIEMSKIQGILAEYEFQKKESKEITDANKVIKILFQMDIPIELLKDSAWSWTVTEIDAHKYIVSGFHPIAKRQTYKNKEFIFV